MERIKQIKEVLQLLNKNHIVYCVLRNYTFLLQERSKISKSERSLDLMLAKRDLPKFETVLKQNGFLKRQPSFSRAHHAYFRIKNLECISFDVQVGGVYWNDMGYLDEKVLERRIWKDFLPVLEDNDLFLMLLIHSILGKRMFKPEYQRILTELKINQEYVMKGLNKTFGNKKAQLLLERVKSNQFNEIKPYLLVLPFIMKHLPTFIPLSLRWLFSRKRYHPLISIIGPDGAGKSTIVKSLAEYLQSYDRHVSIIYTGRGRGQILPTRRIGNIYKKNEKEKDYLSKPRKRVLLYTLVAPIFTLDLLLRYIFTIIPARYKGIVITDRYCSDIMLMNHVSTKLKKFLFSLFPRPTLTFYIYTDADTLKQRRPEESLEGLKKQLEMFAVLKKELKPIEITTNNLDLKKEIVNSKVLAYLYRNWY